MDAVTTSRIDELEKRLLISSKRVMNVDEAYQYLGMAKSYLYKLTCLRKIPFSKPNGGKIYFDREKLDEWLLSNRIKSNDELEIEASTYITCIKK